ncbi:hypothetical protein BB560_001103 [Smittium megazygosporum]|uniref:Mitochondrial GTPase 1 n=1 Tax=Smittium megazygosporum TaxID=133381 RepID=A0A2T9ZIF4_9FUNG|nr:hypothetical protein BB560_001103 [Smittium megazygosporum]
MSVISKFRTSFDFSIPIHWHPGHMSKSLMKMKQMINDIDLFIEIRDSRIPISSINSEFEKMIGDKKRIVVYSRQDLAPTESQSQLEKSLKTLGYDDFCFMNCKSLIDTDRLLNRIKKNELKSAYGIKRSSAMVVGMPNVGKSTLLNSLRKAGVNKGKASKAGATPGLTKSLASSVRILEYPELFLYDTPGVMPPFNPNPISTLKFALTGGIKDNLLEYEIIADYLLFRLNNSGSTEYVTQLGLQEPTDNINELLTHVCHKIGALHKGGIPDYPTAARFFVSQYRYAKYGLFCLDDVSVEGIQKQLDEMNDPSKISKNQLKKEHKKKLKERSLERYKRKMGI